MRPIMPPLLILPNETPCPRLLEFPVTFEVLSTFFSFELSTLLFSLGALFSFFSFSFLVSLTSSLSPASYRKIFLHLQEQLELATQCPHSHHFLLSPPTVRREQTASPPSFCFQMLHQSPRHPDNSSSNEQTPQAGF